MKNPLSEASRLRITDRASDNGQQKYSVSLAKFYCMRFLLFISSLLLCTSSLLAQFYTTGTDPASSTWNQIKTDKFQVIYPIGAERPAQRLANSLYLSADSTSYGLRSKVRKPIKIVMHNQSVISNGFVVWAPRRMEIVSTPPQSNYAQNWIEQLALHEYRHVAQMEKLNQGFTRVLSYLAGDIAVGATAGYLPLWFLEGDAVLNESRLSSTGRGREPDFMQGLMAIELQEKKRYTYDQMYLGTYKTATPNHYQFGYQMVAWAEDNYPRTWQHTIENVAKRSFMFVPFYQGLKKSTGLSKVKLYNHTFDTLKQKWQAENQQIVESKFEEIPTNYRSNFVSYKNLQVQSNDSFIAIRTTIDDVAKLVRIENGNEEVLKTIGVDFGGQIAVTDRYIAWQDLRFDPRWEQRSYSVIKILDLNTNLTSILKRKERHFSPSINPATDKIAVIRNNTSNTSIIEIYDIQSKYLIEDFEHPEKEQLSYNRWINDSLLAVVCNGDRGKSIYALNIVTEEWEKLFGPTFKNISNVQANENMILFTHTLDGRQNIYTLDLQSENVSRVTNSKIGVDFADISADGKTLYVSEYTSEGYKPRKLELAKIEKTAIDDIAPYDFAFVDEPVKSSRFNIQDTAYAHKQFESKPYNKLLHSVNLHSWLVPFYADVDDISSDFTALVDEVYPGVTLFTQNMLSTVTSSIGLYRSNGYNYFRPSVTLNGMYPKITFDMTYGGPAQLLTSNADITSLPGELKRYCDAGATVSLPLNLSTGSYTSYFTPAMRLSYENFYVVDSNNYADLDYDIFDNGLYYYKDYMTSEMIMQFYIMSKSAEKALNPKWGAYLYFNHKTPHLNTVHFSAYENTVLLGMAYLPGFFRHHSIELMGGYEDGYGMRMSLARGYDNSDLIIQRQGGLYYYYLTQSKLLSASYSLPILYPDISVGPLAYIKRIHAELFYDRTTYDEIYTYGGYYDQTGSLTSFGAELGFEMNFLRFFVPFTPTIRYSYLKTLNDSRFSFFVTSSYSF